MRGICNPYIMRRRPDTRCSTHDGSAAVLAQFQLRILQLLDPVT